MSRRALVVKTKTIFPGFITPVADMIFGDETISQRLIRQLNDLGVQHENLEESRLQDAGGQCVLYDDAIYSMKILKMIFANGWVYKHAEKNNIEVETQMNPTIVYQERPQKLEPLNLSSCEEKISEVRSSSQHDHPKMIVRQSSLFSYPLNIPPVINPNGAATIEITDIFFHRLKTWPDILTAQSLIAKESAVTSISILRKFVPEKWLSSILTHPVLAKLGNRIGKNCRIHPTAHIEASIIGDNVEIGPYCYIRGSIVGSGAVVREFSSVKVSCIGKNSQIPQCNMFNSYIGSNSLTTTFALFHSVMGNSTFVGGAVGFTDLNSHLQNIQAVLDNKNPAVKTDYLFLGSAVAEHSFIATGLFFQSGRLIPHHTTLLNNNTITKADFAAEKYYVAMNGKITQIPKQFLKGD